MTQTTALLSDVTGPGEFLYDAETGAMLRDDDGRPDRPEDYVVIRQNADGGYAVCGPSGQIDHTDPADHTRLYRDAE